MKKEIVQRGESFGILPFESTLYSTDKGEISMLTPCKATFYNFEIYCTKGYLFDDIERYATLEDTEARIKELLN